MTTIRINVSKPYDVLIAPGLLDRAGEILRSLSDADKIALICGDIVCPLYAERAVRALEGAGFSVFVKTIPHGEEYKTLATYGEILSCLFENELSRNDLVVALGGGVTGDLAGFSSACYQRGCPFVQIPTTLLSAVDASVGGKVAVNLPGGKNQVGLFYQPLAVLCDPTLFSSLPVRELRNGLAEIVKYGVLFDSELFNSLLDGYSSSLAETLIGRSVDLKRAVIERDEHDLGERRFLNFGHTFGHAVEQCSNYALSHGEAVSIGMAMMARASAKRGFCDTSFVDELVSLLSKLGLPTDCPIPAVDMLKAVYHDKKRFRDAVCLVVPREIGRCELLTVPLADLHGWLLDGGAL